MSQTNKVTFGAGCFWGIQYEFDKLNGVVETAVGFMGGDKENPTYKEVCSDKTAHAEVVEVKYEPDKISYTELLKKFFEIHDPTQVNKQGLDIGSQYRSVIFYYGNEQKESAEEMKKELQQSGKFGARAIATAIEPAGAFWKAEEYHQKYMEKTGRKVC